MKLGIIGLPQSGKTTLFNALTRGDQPTVTNGGRFDVHQAVVDVPDERVVALSAMFKPHKTIFAKVTYADIAGLNGANGNGGLTGQLIQQLSQMDGFIQVVRCFENSSVPHVSGRIDPASDLEAINSELLLNDLIIVERKLQKLEEEKKKSTGRDKAIIEREVNLFNRLQATLNTDQPLRTLELTDEEHKTISGFGFLTLKPMLVVLNLSEDQSSPDLVYNSPRSTQVPLQGKLEMELAQLDEEEAEIFMNEYGIQELSLSRVIRLSYNLMDLISFFTVGEDEVRAWTIPNGANALQAAAALHTDLAKGFIRAEVVDHLALLELGGLVEARQKGKLRLEGKEYIVKDGEIVHIRFNI